MADELPAPARAVPKFRGPTDASARPRWDRAFEGRDLSDLDRAAEVFADLTRAAPDDSAAAFNLGLCLAWKGENRPALAALDLCLQTEADQTQAIAAGVLAEVLRQGGGAEELANDLALAEGVRVQFNQSGRPIGRYSVVLLVLDDGVWRTVRVYDNHLGTHHMLRYTRGSGKGEPERFHPGPANEAVPAAIGHLEAHWEAIIQAWRS